MKYSMKIKWIFRYHVVLNSCDRDRHTERPQRHCLVGSERGTENDSNRLLMGSNHESETNALLIAGNRHGVRSRRTANGPERYGLHRLAPPAAERNGQRFVNCGFNSVWASVFLSTTCCTQETDFPPLRKGAPIGWYWDGSQSWAGLFMLVSPHILQNQAASSRWNSVMCITTQVFIGV